MEPFLKNKTAVVTGGTRGIGYAIARSLAHAGAAVAICGRTADAVDKAVASLSQDTGAHISGMVVDIRQAEAVTRFFEFVDAQFGGPDVLVNNAGLGIFRPVAELSFEDWRTTLDTNLSGAFYCCREALPRMQGRGGGYIVNISSLAGKNPFAGGAAYNASKFGLNGFSEALMLDHRKDKIRVTYVMPGSVATEFSPGESGTEWKIAPEDVADVVMMVLNMPARTTVSRIEMRPSIPQK